MSLSDFSEIFNDTKHRAVSLRQLSFLFKDEQRDDVTSLFATPRRSHGVAKLVASSTFRCYRHRVLCDVL